jgi:Calcineurin-like phosphoesterase
MKRFALVLPAALLVLVIAVAVWPTGRGPATPPADSFHFTVTADMRGYHVKFGNLLEAINDGPGPGIFHISIGDVDDAIPENRARIDDKFGATAIWYPIIGNHEAETPSDMEWLRAEYNTGNNGRPALKLNTNQDGPIGSVETTYSWDYGNAHFIALNEYWDGETTLGSDNSTDANIVPALCNWLATDLAAHTKPFVFVFGHEPAFPYTRHVGESLDQYRANRDAFWSLLEAEDVRAFFCGHTHYYSEHQGDERHVGDVWQFDAGNAGNDHGDGLTYLDIVVGNNQATVNVYRDDGTGIFSLVESVNLTP